MKVARRQEGNLHPSLPAAGEQGVPGHAWMEMADLFIINNIRTTRTTWIFLKRFTFFSLEIHIFFSSD